MTLSGSFKTLAEAKACKTLRVGDWFEAYAFGCDDLWASFLFRVKKIDEQGLWVQRELRASWELVR